MDFLFCAGNQVQLLEAKQCFYVVPGFCNTWKNFVCKLTCKGVCKSFSAHGECRDDGGCHCICCWLNCYIQQWNIHYVKLLNMNYINKVCLHCIFLLFLKFLVVEECMSWNNVNDSFNSSNFFFLKHQLFI